jgi:hypothetical protein
MAIRFTDTKIGMADSRELFTGLNISEAADYEGKALLVGVNYDKETKEHICVIEEFERK